MRRQICGDLGFRIYWLGLQSSAINVTKFLVVPVRSLRVGSLSIVGAGVGTISLKRRLMSNATLNSIPFSINNSKGKELKIVSAATDQSSHQMIGAKDGSYCYSDRDEMGTAQDDQKEIEAMMVQELRATLRKLGIPVKGRKQELISTLRLHMGNRFQGERSGAEEKETTCSTISEIVALKRKLRSSEGSTKDNRFNSDAYGNEHHVVFLLLSNNAFAPSCIV